MNGIKYYALDENEEVPYEFVVIRNVNGEPEFYASFVNTNSLAYENGVLLKFHKRNDELRAENAKLRELAMQLRKTLSESEGEVDTCGHCELFDECAAKNWHECEFDRRMRELGVEVD